MKLFFKITFVFCCFFLFIGSKIEARNIKTEYIVEFGKINIGKLYWEITNDKEYYSIVVALKDKGILSGLYNFDGNYSAKGVVYNDVYLPTQYLQNWKTRKKEKVVELFFDGDSLIRLINKPEEKELPRINYGEQKGLSDPLTSFLKILNGKKKSKTIDGRRVYSMVVKDGVIDKNYLNKIIIIRDYKNIWADHNRIDLKQITLKYSKKNKDFMPEKIIIKYKKVNFVLKKN